MKNYHIVSIALLAGLVIGCAIPAHADQDYFNLACSPMTKTGKLIKSKSGLVVSVKADSFNYGYAQVNSVDTSKPDDRAFGPTITYFKSQAKEDFILFTTRQNKADLKNPADFLAMRLIDNKTVIAWKMRMKAGDVIGPVDYFYCNYM
ncbi:hypothetical protein ET317_21625 [Salmonella enterica]|nr:hypothetical protein [Salmonella enterica]